MSDYKAPTSSGSIGNDESRFRPIRPEDVRTNRMEDRPKKETSSKKDFKKMLDDKEVAEGDDAASNAATASIFALSSGAKDSSLSIYLDPEGAPDLSSARAMMGAPLPGSEINVHQTDDTSVGVSTPTPQIHEIVDQIVDKVYTLRTDGRTETTITLKYPPIFDGAEVKITGYDHAKGEFNITFSNLTQEAKNVLDAQRNLDALNQRFDARGFTVHMIVTTTTIDRPIATDAENRSNRDGSSDDQAEDRREREKRQGRG